MKKSHIATEKEHTYSERESWPPTHTEITWPSPPKHTKNLCRFWQPRILQTESWSCSLGILLWILNAPLLLPKQPLLECSNGTLP
jgi:hypothetical protein